VHDIGVEGRDVTTESLDLPRHGRRLGLRDRLPGQVARTRRLELRYLRPARRHGDGDLVAVLELVLSQPLDEHADSADGRLADVEDAMGSRHGTPKITARMGSPR
jgi:hypothetical protein